jgi:hypothetical protein
VYLTKGDRHRRPIAGAVGLARSASIGNAEFPSSSDALLFACFPLEIVNLVQELFMRRVLA